jgi:hypothetical protein
MSVNSIFGVRYHIWIDSFCGEQMVHTGISLLCIFIGGNIKVTATEAFLRYVFLLKDGCLALYMQQIRLLASGETSRLPPPTLNSEKIENLICSRL